MQSLDTLQQDLADFGYIMSHYGTLPDIDRGFITRAKSDLVGRRIPFHAAERVVVNEIIQFLDSIFHDYYTHD